MRTEEAHWQLAIFTRMANWRKWGNGQESIKGFAKPQMRWQRGKSSQMAIIRKWQILGEREKFRLNGEYAKKSLAKYSHKMTKKGIWTNGDLFIKDLTKTLNETTKEAFLVCNHVIRLPCGGGGGSIQ